MEKILFVENLSLKKDNPMSTCYNLKCYKIKNDNRFHFYDISENEKIDTSEYNTVIFGFRSIYLYKCYIGNTKRQIMQKNFELCKIKNKYFIIQDMHRKTYRNIDPLCKFLNENNINIIFTFYNNNEAYMIRKKTPNVKHLYLPHYIDTSLFKYMGLEKKYDILLFGAIHPSHYPFRKRLFDLILNNKNLFNVYYIEKPEFFDPNVCEEGLAKLINMSKICIATKSKYDYMVGKYFEISMCKSLIAGNIPTDGINIFKNNIVELHENMTDNEIIEKLQSALINYDKYHDNIDYLYNYSNNNHSLNIYTDKLYMLVKN